MADLKITELGAASALTGTELIETVQGGVNVKTTTQDIADLGATGGGHVIEDEGTPLVQRADLNFVGAGVSVADTGGKTTVTISGGGSISDGDKGDITVSASGATWTVDNLAITNAKINDVALGKVSGLGTGVATALAVNVGTAGAPVVNGGALGTPSSGTGTNITGLVAANVVNTAAGGIAATTVQAAINELDTDKVDAIGSFRRLTGDHTFDSTDLASINAGDNLFIEMNVGSANTVTIPLNATQAFPVGTVVNVTQYGAGQTSFVATGGVTINSSAGPGILTVPSRYTPSVLLKVATNEWYLFNGGVSPTIPVIQDWSASLAATGFSSTTILTAHYTDDGEIVRIWFIISGTSNATTFGFSLPLATNSAYGTAGIVYPVTIQNNGVTAVGRMVVNGTATGVDVNSTITGSAFMNSGTKAIRGTLFYEK